MAAANGFHERHTSPAAARTSYDSLKRLVGGVTYCYDAHHTASCPATGTVGYLERLTAVTNGNSTNLYNSFDALGRVTRSQEVERR